MLYVYILSGVCVGGGGVLICVCKLLHTYRKSNPHISIFDENEVFGEIIMFLIPISIKCQWLVLKFGCKVYKNDKNRSSKHSDSSCLCEVLTRCHRYVP